MRLTDAGDVYVLEVNSPCDLTSTSEFAAGAQAAGIDHVTLINRIADLAVQRRAPEPRLLSWPGGDGRRRRAKKPAQAGR